MPAAAVERKQVASVRRRLCSLLAEVRVLKDKEQAFFTLLPTDQRNSTEGAAAQNAFGALESAQQNLEDAVDLLTTAIEVSPTVETTKGGSYRRSQWQSV